MIIRGIRQTSQGVYEITPDAGSAFFLRSSYLEIVPKERLVPVCGGLAGMDTLFVDDKELKPGMDGVFSEDDTTDILHAAVVYRIELAAMNYLARAEQCRSGLSSKLIKKGLNKKDVEMALDYLEESGYLDDYRFAGAWIRTRYVTHAEGRTKLSAELSSRGVESSAIKSALDDFFKDHSTEDLCDRALRKYLRTHKNPEENKIYSSLQRSGFSYSQIKSAISKNM